MCYKACKGVMGVHSAVSPKSMQERTLVFLIPASCKPFTSWCNSRPPPRLSMHTKVQDELSRCSDRRALFSLLHPEFISRCSVLGIVSYFKFLIAEGREKEERGAGRRAPIIFEEWQQLRYCAICLVTEALYQKPLDPLWLLQWLCR